MQPQISLFLTSFQLVQATGIQLSTLRRSTSPSIPLKFSACPNVQAAQDSGSGQHSSSFPNIEWRNGNPERAWSTHWHKQISATSAGPVSGWGGPGGPDWGRNVTCRSRRSAAPHFQDCTVTATRTLWIRCRSSAAIQPRHPGSDRGRVQITARQLASNVQRCWRDQWRSRSTQSLAPIVPRLSGCPGCGADSGLLISSAWSYLGARQRVSELLHCILWRGRGTSVCCRCVR